MSGVSVGPRGSVSQLCSLSKDKRALAFKLWGGNTIFLTLASGYEEAGLDLQKFLTDLSCCLRHADCDSVYCDLIRFGSINDERFGVARDNPQLVRLQIALRANELLLWDPARLHPAAKVHPSCPECGGKASGDGWAPTIRCILSLDGLLWVLTKRAECTRKHGAEGKQCQFALTDERVLATLPPHVRHLFPGALTKQSGVTHILLDLMASLAAGGTSVKQMVEARNERVAIIYVDNSDTTGNLLAECFPDMPRDGGVKEDLFHVLQRVCDCLPDGHSLKDAFMRDLSAAFKVFMEEDVKKQQVLGKEPSAKTCRTLVPPPKSLAARVEHVLAGYSNALCCNSAELLLNPGAMKQLSSVLRLIRAGRISDPEGREMHANLEPDPSKPPKWACFRGTSQVEGWHKHLHALLSGANNSPELFVTYLTLFVGRWNRRQAIKRGEASYGTHNYHVLWEINQACERAGLPVPYPEANVRTTSVQEEFHFNWQELEGLPLLRAEIAVAQDRADSCWQLLIAPSLDVAVELVENFAFAPVDGLFPQGTGRSTIKSALLTQFMQHGWWVKEPRDLPEGVGLGPRITRLPWQLVLGSQEAVWNRAGAAAQQLLGPLGGAGGLSNSSGGMGAADARTGGGGAGAAAASSAHVLASSPHASLSGLLPLPQLLGPLGGGGGSDLGHGRTLQPVQPRSSTAGRSRLVSGGKGPGRLKAFLRRGLSGSSRKLTVADTMQPVRTTAEKELFWELYSQYTRGTRTNWPAMTKAWNLRVAEDKPAHVHAKREKHLKEYEKAVGKQIGERDSLALMQSVALRPYVPLTPQQAAADAIANVFSAPPMLSPAAAPSPPPQQSGGQRTLTGAVVSTEQPTVKAVKGSRATATGEDARGTRGKGGEGVPKTCKQCSARLGYTVYRRLGTECTCVGGARKDAKKRKLGDGE